MNPSPFEITFRRSRGNLHVQPRGPLDCHNAQQLLDLLREHYDGAGLVFVDTGALQDVHPQAADTFKVTIESDAVIPISRLVFKGSKGFGMAPEGCRVLITPQKRCCGRKGNCTGCNCHSHRGSCSAPSPGGTKSHGASPH